MTLIIGIICKDAIILGADSQTTRAGSTGGAKRNDALKIAAVKFSSKEILVAHAGNAGNGERAIELLRGMAKDAKISDYRTPADMASAAMVAVKRELRRQYGDCPMTEMQDLIWKEDLQTELMLAYYFNDKPYLYKLDLAVGRSDKEYSWFSAVGAGGDLGSYLLSEYTSPGMTMMLASQFVGHIIKQVCKHNAYCGLPASFGVISNDIAEVARNGDPEQDSPNPLVKNKSTVFICTPNPNSYHNKKIEKIIQSAKPSLNKKLVAFIRSETKKGMKEWKMFMENPTYKGLMKLRDRMGSISHIGCFDK